MIGIAIANSIGSRRSSGSVVVVPVATAATGVGQTSFTANWNAFAGANYYLLDVSLNSSFSSFVGSYQNYVVIGTSQLVSGLTPNTTYYYRLRAATGIDSDAASFFTRVYTAGGTLSYTEVTATETLVSNLKSYGIWTAMRAVYPMVGASAAACAQNLKSSSFTGTFTSGFTFASTGVTGNGTSAFFNTTCSPSQMAQNSMHMSYYSRSDIAQFGMMGASNVGILNLCYINPRFTNGNYYTHINNSDGATTLFGLSSTSLGFYLSERTTSTNNRYFRNGTLVNSGTFTSVTPSNNSIYVCASNFPSATEYSSRECAFASIGDGLTDTQAANFYTCVNTFQTTLSRNV